MRSAGGYKTKQRAAVEAVLRENEQHFTVEQLAERLNIKGESVGRTTVYRCVERLVAEGKVRKYAAEQGESACYQYVAENHECQEHFHLKCTGCGKLIHIECDHMNELSSHIAAEHRFAVDPLKTVLYGICEECAKK